MFLRKTQRKKDGKTHDYWSRCREQARGRRGCRTAPRSVLGRDQLLAGGRVARRPIEVLDDDAGLPRTLALFPEDPDVLRWRPTRRSVQLRLSDMRLCRPRQWGACWLAGQLWRDLRLEQFWAERLPPNPQGYMRWDQVLHVLVSYRLIAPGSEWKLHRVIGSARAPWPEPVGGGLRTGGGATQAVRYCHDFLLQHKDALFSHLTAALGATCLIRILMCFSTI